VSFSLSSLPKVSMDIISILRKQSRLLYDIMYSYRSMHILSMLIALIPASRGVGDYAPNFRLGDLDSFIALSLKSRGVGDHAPSIRLGGLDSFISLSHRYPRISIIDSSLN
jgi:hypothetical protein